MNDKFYSYNIKQSNFLMMRGARCLGTSIHPETKRVFHCFKYDEVEHLLKEWGARKDLYQTEIQKFN